MSALAAAGIFYATARPEAHQDALRRLETVRALKCVFPLLVNGTWKKGESSVEVKQSTPSMRFDSINTEESTASVTDSFGHFEITAVRHDPPLGAVVQGGSLIYHHRLQRRKP
jgi:hypothetical protein